MGGTEGLDDRCIRPFGCPGFFSVHGGLAVVTHRFTVSTVGASVPHKKNGTTEESASVEWSLGKWYAVRTYSGQERKVKMALDSEISHSSHKDDIYQVFVPTENVVEMVGGKKRVRNKVYFPGYILIQMMLNRETQYLIENTTGVLNFIGPKNQPEPLREPEVKRILGEADERQSGEVIEVPFSVGDSIRVIDGPFNDFSGLVQEINLEKQKVKVLVSIFGRATPVELDFLQVELEK